MPSVTRPVQRAARADDGVVAVEAAITLMTFFVCIFAIVEGARFLNVKQTLTNAAREGARMAVAPLSGTSTLASNAEVEARVNVFLNAAGIRTALVAVERPVDTGGGVSTRVRITLPYRTLTLAMFDSLEVTLEGEAVMRNETSP